ncbi:hypothetical protein O181_017978 [Austropuccinia psidii MF-1]|uniref:Uncharacterized protein n=1 Tax=Austropuccinia psidii MF-1 TaxID=1389203 RepID=A0A9Q3C738_9BASI|nr:hypothetical protein [Austropuccinia psidii MF-1]
MPFPSCACVTCAPSPATEHATGVKHKFSIPLDIRPSHAFAFVCVSHPWARSSVWWGQPVSPTDGKLIHRYTKLGQHIIWPLCACHTCTPAPAELCGWLHPCHIQLVNPAHANFFHA